MKYGVERDHDLPWSDKKVTLFKTLEQMRAFDDGSARSSTEIAKKSGMSLRDVRHYAYHARAGQLVKVIDRAKPYKFCLTCEGADLAGYLMWPFTRRK